MTARTGAAAIGLGVALVAAHVALVPAWVARTARPTLAVEWPHGLVSDELGVGAVTPGVDATVTRDGAAPGLVVTRYTARYRGGITRTVAAPALVGPFQDPSAPPCTGRIAVGQRLLDGDAGSVAAIVRAELTAALRTTEVFAIGAFQRVDAIALRWVGLYDVPFEAGMFPAKARAAPAPGGYLRAEATVVFERVKIVVVLGALPRTDGGALGFTVGLRAHVAVDNRALAWLVDRLGVDRLATRFARGQLDTALLAALGPPPPLPLPGGGELAIEVCPDVPVEVVADHHAAVALRWRLTAPVAPAAGQAAIRPPRRGPVAFPPPRADATITIDLDLDGVNGLLYQLWRTGFLDRELDQLDLAGRFNHHPVVETYLTLRLSPLRLALPPVLAPAPPDHLRLGLVAAVAIGDGAQVTPATAVGQVALGFAPGDQIATDVAIAGLDLSCEPRPGHLEPCYGDVVAAVRDSTGDTHAALGAALSTVLTDLFVGQRLAADAAPAELAIDGARAETIVAATAVRLELAARITPPTP
ncbi:MAG: hypothetical protein IPL61_37910 [Myxococcales bacterium]|nr:hypothetical protein [Myxococcales bacterium]